MQRFDLKQDSTGTWSVVDTLTGLPVEASGRHLTGLGLEEAQQAVFMANTGILRDVANRRRGLV